jgi:hypothetical protein
MPASDIPGYVQGYRFSDDAAVYTSGTQTFIDQAGYGADLTITTGAPVFATVGSERFLTLDNTFHGSCKMPIPWHGSIITVIKPVRVSGGTLSRIICIFGDAVNATSNGLLWVQYNSGNRTIYWWGPNGTLSTTKTRSDDNTVAFGAAHDQETRKLYSTIDGVTVTETSAAAGTTDGNAPSMLCGLTGARFGDLDGDPAVLTAMADFYLQIAEIHFFQENIWTQYPTEAAAFMAELRTKYGVT